MISVPNVNIKSLVHFLSENTDLVYKQTMNSIVEFFNSDPIPGDVVMLFKAEKSNYFVGIERKDVPQLLQIILDYFVTYEFYEDAEIAKQLLTKVTIENIIG